MTENQEKAKEYLKQIASIEEAIDNKMVEIDRLEALATGVSAIRYDKDKVQTSPRDSMSDTVIRVVELKNELARKVDHLIDVKSKSMNILDDMKIDHQNLIYMHFFQHMSFRQMEMKFIGSESTMIRAYMDALEEFGRRIVA